MAQWDHELRPSRTPGGAADEDARGRVLGYATWAAVGVTLLVAMVLWQDYRRIATITAEETTLARDAEGSERFPQINSQINSQIGPRVEIGSPGYIYYRVVLAGAPRRWRLDMGCEWQAPSGEVVHEVRYETRRIDKVPWPTRCRHRFDDRSPAGTWTVRMYSRERLIARTDFEVVRP